MAEKTKLQLQIEASEKRIQEEQQRLKLLEKKQTERDRKDRSHRLCKRHGYLESIIPDTINLTDEQFQDFVKQHIANKHGLAVIANLMGKAAQPNAAANTAAPAEPKPQNGGAPVPNGTGLNNGNHAPKNAAQNATSPANTKGATA